MSPTPTKFAVLDGQLHIQVDGHLVPIPADLQKEVEQVVNDYFNESEMPPPARVDLPFFAYGLFKPGQLGFDNLRPHLQSVVADEKMHGELFERDGVPLFVGSSDMAGEEIIGALITFASGQGLDAYKKIASIEPVRQYLWKTRTTKSGTEANVLVSKSQKGAHRIEKCNWDGQGDPLFSSALDLVVSIAATSQYETGTEKRLMELQMAYMLLWTAIERYASLRYHLRKKVMAKIRHIADEPGFIDALGKYATEERTIYSTDAGDPEKLSSKDPKGSLRYYYQVRSNVTHRGKALMTDAVLLKKCIDELQKVFRDTIACAFEECKQA